MYKKTLTVLAAAFAFTLAGCGGESSSSASSSTASTASADTAAEPIVLRVGYENHPGEPFDLGCQKWQELLEQKSGGTMKIAHAPEFWVFCADFTRLRRIAQLPDLIPFPMFFHAVNDCSLACQNALTAAEAQGLGGVIIGGFKAQIVKISALLQIPRYAAPVLGLALGVPDEAYREEQKPRLPMEWLFTDNTYHDGFNADDFAAYNERYREYTAQRKYNNEPKTWSEACLAMLSRKNPQSDKLAAFYQAQGFAIGD